MRETGKNISHRLQETGSKKRLRCSGPGTPGSASRRPSETRMDKRQSTITHRQSRRMLRSKLLSRRARIQNRKWNPADARGLEPLTWAEIVVRGARPAMRETFEQALAERPSDVYRFLEFMCLNELVEAEPKTREMDVLEVLRAFSQAKALQLKVARVQSQNAVAEAHTKLAGLQFRLLTSKIAGINKKAKQGSEANKGVKPFNYDRALNQISAVIGLRPGEEFLHDEQQPQPNQS